MIHGDIDLTENLDFYKDRKSLEYKNSRDFDLSVHHKKQDSDTHLVDSMTSTISFTTTYSNNTTYRWYMNDLSLNIPTSYNQNNTSYINWQLNNLISSVSDTPIYDEYNYNTWYNDIAVVVNDENVMYRRISTVPNITGKPSVWKKLFGNKDKYGLSWSSDPSRLLFSLFGKRYEKIYRNSRDFDNDKYDNNLDDTSYSRVRHKYLSWTGSYFDWREHDNSATTLFNSRENPSSKYEKGVPWLNDLKRSNKQAYDNYMEDLYNEDKDYSSYLTNYSWLRMR